MRPIDEAAAGSTQLGDPPQEPMSSSSDDPRVAAALEEFLAELEAGRRPERAEFLQRHAAIAHLLAESLDGLLMVHSASPTFKLPEARPFVGDGLAPLSTVGDFRIVRELGRGGMGVVYEAEQVSLGRRVALKILPLAAALDARRRERFQLEAQAAAHLHHPHIVPVFAVGSDHGVDYYAMQYVEGRTLADLIKDFRQAATSALPASSESGSGSTSSGTPASDSSHGSRAFLQFAARIGAQAAEALEHAHGLGVLHRDIKPSNLMIDAGGDLWVTDFGLARFQEEEGLTRTGDVIGTLRYMSPEQSHAQRGVVDQRADVYSLGATLYELITLQPIFEGSDRQELLRQVALDEPTPPRKWKPSVPRDLETILLKSLSKEVGRRYGSARDLADDLKRFLDNRPVEARRPTALDRAAKWSRRHRAPLVAALVVLFGAAIITTGLLWRERQLTLQTLGELRQALERERRNMRFIFSASDQIMMQAMGSLTVTNPMKGTEPGGFYVSALEAYKQIAKQTRNDPEMRLVAADAFRRVGFIQMIGRYVHRNAAFQNADAEGSYSESLALLDQQLAATPGRADVKSQKAEVLNELSTMVIQVHGVERSEPLYRESVAIARGLASNDSALRSQWAERAVSRADLLAQLGRFAEAEAVYSDGLEIDPDNPAIMNNLAWLLCSEPGRVPHDPARAIALASKATERSAHDASYWNTLAMANYRSGRWAEAKTAVERSMRLHPPDPHDWLLLAMVEAKLGKTAEAQRNYDRGSEAVKTSATQGPELLGLQKEAAALLKAGR